MNNDHDILAKNDKNGGSTLSHEIIERMTRMEHKLDSYAQAHSEALVKMAHTEEKILRLLDNDREKTKWISSLQERVVELEKTRTENSAISRRFERFLWILLNLSMAGGAAYFAGKM